MINNKDLDAYMNIKAPAELKERVMGDLNKTNSHISIKIRTCYALAAVLLVIVAIFAFLPNSQTSLYYGTTPIDKNVVISSNDGIALLSTRTINDIPVRVETDKKTVVSVSMGDIILPNGESGSSVTVSDDTVIIWSIDLTPDADGAVMSVGKSSYCISLNDNSEWVISKKK